MRQKRYRDFDGENIDLNHINRNKRMRDSYNPVKSAKIYQADDWNFVTRQHIGFIQQQEAEALRKQQEAEALRKVEAMRRQQELNRFRHGSDEAEEELEAIFRGLDIHSNPPGLEDVRSPSVGLEDMIAGQRVEEEDDCFCPIQFGVAS